VIDGSMVVVNTRAMIDHETIYYGEEGAFPIEETPHHMDTSGVDCMIDEEVDEKDFELSEGEAVATTALEGFIIKALEDRKTAGMVALRYDRVRTPIKEPGGWKNDIPKAREVVLPINSGLSIPDSGSMPKSRMKNPLAKSEPGNGVTGFMTISGYRARQSLWPIR
jgi:hypothetical protein